MARTIVASDLHGNVPLLERILSHSAFAEGDRLILAGDLIDVGMGDVVGPAEHMGATILAGNHEVSAALGLRISPQNPESLERGPELAQRFASGEWPLAVSVDGWLVTHAGVSSALSDIVERAGREPAAVADALNSLFQREIADAAERLPLEWDELDRYRLLGGQLGPLWFRPDSANFLPSGLQQVVGHTPPEMYSNQTLAQLTAAGFLLVEAGGHSAGLARAEAGRMFYPAVRYAIIENGSARVVEA